MSENGWTDDFLCKEWFKKSFIPQATVQNTSSKPILLIYDGHGSHEQLELINLAQEHNIILFCLPPHTTHKLQPLDVGVFSPFQRAWSERCDEIVEDAGGEMPREDFVKEYMDVRSKTFKPTTIVTAFRKSGFWPVNRDVFTDEDYAPSIPTSTSSCHVPSSFPVGIQDLDDESNDEYPAVSKSPSPVEYPNSESDDKLPSDDANDAINDSKDSQTNTGVSRPPSSPQRPVLSHHPPPGAPSSVMPISTTLPICACSVALEPIPPSRFYGSTTRPRRKHVTGHPIMFSNPPVQAQLDTLLQASNGLSQQITELHSENSMLKAHCAIAGTQIQELKQQLNTKENRPQKRRKLNVDARWLNSDEGLRLAEEQEALRVAGDQKKREAREQRTAKEVEREEQRLQRDPTAPFAGALTSKTKADLQDIAQVLGLATDGQKKDILARINTRFDANPVLRDDLRFEGMFNQTRKRPAMQTEDPTSTQAGPSLSIPLSQPPLPALLSSNIVNSHSFLYTSLHPGPSSSPSFFPFHPMHAPLPYHHHTSNADYVINSHSHHNPYSTQS